MRFQNSTLCIMRCFIIVFKSLIKRRRCIILRPRWPAPQRILLSEEAGTSERIFQWLSSRDWTFFFFFGLRSKWKYPKTPLIKKSDMKIPLQKFMVLRGCILNIPVRLWLLIGQRHTGCQSNGNKSQTEFQTFSGSSSLNVRIFCFSLSLTTADKESFARWWNSSL